MEAFFLFTVSAIIINRSTARGSHGSSSGIHGGIGGGSGSDSDSDSSSDSTVNLVVIIVPCVVGFIFIVLFIVCCRFYCIKKKQRMGVLPLSNRIAFAQQGNQYAPPSYVHPPPYSAVSAPIEPTKVTVSS